MRFVGHKCSNNNILSHTIFYEAVKEESNFMVGLSL